MNVNKSSVGNDELSASVKTTVASKIMHALATRVGTIFRAPTPGARDTQRSIPLLTYEALERRRKEEELVRHRAFLAARF